MALRIGRYETLRPIAAGGMATVHLARSVGAGGFERLVALKAMHPHLAEEPEFIAMFLDEARLAAGVRHPNVVATIDVQQDDDGVFLVMEFVDGPALHKVLRHLRKHTTPLPLGVAVRITLDVLAGLHAAHELAGPGGAPLSLVHRDVSPQNILVGLDGIARITDFGVARAESRLSSTRGGQIKGKLPYMAPEQIHAEVLDRRCDVYAAGAVLWEMLVGSRLHQADNDGALVAKIIGGDVRPVRELRPDVPEVINEVCRRALATFPKDRYASAADFSDALEDAAASGGVAVASARVVGAFVRAQGIHTPLTQLIEMPAPSVAPAAGRGATPASAPVLAPQSAAPVSEISSPSVGSAQTEGASVLSTPHAFPRGRRPLTLALLVLGMVAVPLAFFTFRPADEPPAASAADAAAVQTAPLEAARPAAETPPAAQPAIEPVAAGAASSAGRAASSAAPSSRASAKPAAAVAPKATSKAVDDPNPPATPTSFRPNGL